MKTSLWIHGLLLLSASSVIVAKKKNETGWITIDDDVKEEPNQTLEQSSGSGSGLCPDDEEDCNELSGSGFGEPTEWSPATKVPEIITSRLLTSCEQLRNSAKVIQMSKDSIFIPECLEDGSYKKLQCNREKEDRECWCVNDNGRQITGTYMKYPLLPDCEKGSNLPPCIYKTVQSAHGLLGEPRPRCTDDGEFEKQQCFAMDCWCVNKHGEELSGTRKTIPEIPNCDEKIILPVFPSPTTIKPILITKPKDKGHKKHHHKHTTTPPDETKDIPDFGEGTDIEDDKEDNTKIDVQVGNGKTDQDQTKYETENDINDNYAAERKKNGVGTAAEQIMTQPGVLAAIIGGAVVGLLCAVLLVMFIVYRMRKKDEGSYALDEPKKYDNIAYTKAPDKEFYA